MYVMNQSLIVIRKKGVRSSMELSWPEIYDLQVHQAQVVMLSTG